MTTKTKAAVKRQLKEDYERACTAYVTELLRMWELDACYGYWVADEVGGVYAYGDFLFLGIDDIRYIVENDCTESDYTAWQDYCVKASTFGFPTPNYPSWHKGCPRTDEATFERLQMMKDDFTQAVEEEKKRQGGF